MTPFVLLQETLKNPPTLVPSPSLFETDDLFSDDYRGWSHVCNPFPVSLCRWSVISLLVTDLCVETTERYRESREDTGDED